MVTCWSRAPSAELGAIVPLSELQKQGLCEFRYKDEILLSPADIAWCDILFIVRGTSSQHVWAAQWAKKHERIVLGYWDDNFLAIPEYSLIYGYYSSSRVKANIDTLFRLTDAFFSPNTKLATTLATLHGRDVKILPVLQGAERVEPPSPRKDGPSVVGYGGGQDHIKILNSLVGPVIAEVARTGADFRVHVVGPKPDFIGKLPVETKYTPSIPDYYSYLAFASKLEWDIGLAPQWDSEFTTYKFYNKLLEYAHIGCAGIYSKLEPYSLVIQDGVTGLLVPNEVAAWRDAILRLLKDPELRFKIASNAYEFVRKHHNRKTVAEQYKETLAPFLAYRAPALGDAYVFSRDLAGGPGCLWRIAVEYVRVYGFWYVLRRSPGYLFRLLGRRAADVRSRR